MAELRVLSTMGVAGVMAVLGPQFEQAEGVTLASTFLPTQVLMQRIQAGEGGDVAILTAEALDELAGSGTVQRDSLVPLALSFVGLAVRAGAPWPDIATPDAFIATLLAAPSVVMYKAGASGIFLAGLLQRLGIADRVKSIILPSGYTAEPVARGEAAIALQQVSELMVVPGVEIVGRLPPGLGGSTTFSAGVFAGSTQPGPAAALIRHLASPSHHTLLRERGLEPPR